MILEGVFWCSVGLVFYAYAGYPSALLALSLIRNRPVRKRPAHFEADDFTSQERRIVRRLLHGDGPKQIACAMRLSPPGGPACLAAALAKVERSRVAPHHSPTRLALLRA